MFKPLVRGSGTPLPFDHFLHPEQLPLRAPLQRLKSALQRLGRIFKPTPRTLDMEPMLRRELDLPRQPVLVAMNTGTVFTVTADLQGFDIDSLQMELTRRLFTLSGWVSHKPGEAFATDFPSQSGAFKASRIVPASMDLDNFTLHFNHGLLTFSVPRKQRVTCAYQDGRQQYWRSDVNEHSH
jgi:HSP20 family molecular chaperone IbpA